jgi:alkane 1-monooxygenase
MSRIRAWSLHLLCFVLPLTTLGFVLTGPHPWYFAWPWLGIVAASVVIDSRAGPARGQPTSDRASWPFDVMLVALAVLQMANVVFLARLVALSGLWSTDALVGGLLVGINSGYSAIVVAHELIHRPSKTHQRLGRLLLCTVMYEHFSTEHLRGHHARVGTPGDPATARFGERFGTFWRRTIPAQFRSAWRLEAKRLGDETMRWHDPRLLRSRVVHGLVAQISFALLLTFLFGGGALAVFLGQAFLAVTLLEAVNYFEHWGLSRDGKKISTVDSWDAESWFTLYSLVGLSRHADHHAHATRAYQDLRWSDESPKLPRGYFGMVVMVLARNDRFRDLMTEELRRRKLGPFAEPAAAF